MPNDPRHHTRQDEWVHHRSRAKHVTKGEANQVVTYQMLRAATVQAMGYDPILAPFRTGVTLMADRLNAWERMVTSSSVRKRANKRHAARKRNGR